MNTNNLSSIVVSKGLDGVWEALHVPSGKKATAQSPTEAHDAMKSILGMTQSGDFVEPLTSDRFEGLAKAIALFVEGPVSKSLSFHAGWARLLTFNDGKAIVRMGGGCRGCPSSSATLFNVIKSQLQGRFGDDVVLAVESAD